MMKLWENEYGGQSASLQNGDSLEDVPQPLRSLVLPHVAAAFEDPRVVFSGIAQRTRLRNLANYLQTVIAHNHWQLLIEEAFTCDRITRVGFHWYHPKCQPTTLVLNAKPVDHPEFASMFDLIESTCWDRISCAGEILPMREFHSLIDYGIPQDFFSSESQPTIFGSTQDGDVLVYDLEGRAAMVSHESGDVILYSSILECCEWIFGQLLNGTTPEFDFRRVQPKGADSQRPFPLRLIRPEES